MRYKSYRRFDRAYKDYNEIVTYDEQGKKHVEVKYPGSYYRSELTDASRRIHKIASVILLLSGLALIIAASALDLPSNRTVYVTIFTALIIILVLVCFAYTYLYITSPAETDRRHYVMNHLVYPKLVLGASVLSSMMFLSLIIFGILNPGSFSKLYILCMVFCILAAACFFGIFILEYKTTYSTRMFM